MNKFVFVICFLLTTLIGSYAQSERSKISEFYSGWFHSPEACAHSAVKRELGLDASTLDLQRNLSLDSFSQRARWVDSGQVFSDFNFQVKGDDRETYYGWIGLEIKKKTGSFVKEGFTLRTATRNDFETLTAYTCSWFERHRSEGGGGKLYPIGGRYNRIVIVNKSGVVIYSLAEITPWQGL